MFRKVRHSAAFLHLYLPCLLLLGAAHALYAQVKVNFPVPNQIFYPNRLVRIAWDNQSNMPADVRYSLDKGTNWITIATGLTTNEFEWRLPDLDTVSITFKVESTSIQMPQELTVPMKNKAGVTSAFFNPSGRLIFATLEDGTMNVRTSDNGVVQASVNLSTKVNDVVTSCFSKIYPDTAYVGVGREIAICDYFGKQIRFGGTEHLKNIRCIAAHPSRPILATACEDGSVRIWSIPERKLVRTITSQLFAPMNAVCFSADGSKIVYAGDEGIVYVEEWEQSGTKPVELRGHGNGGSNLAVLSVAISSDGRKVVSGGVDYSVRIWDVESAQADNIMFAHTANVSCVRFSPDGTRILSGSLDKSVRQWSLATGTELHLPLLLADEVSAVDYSPTGDTLLTANLKSGRITLWRNLQINGASDSVTGYIKYPIGLRVGSVSAPIGNSTFIPILLNKVISVPYFERTRFNASCSVVLPSKLLAVEDSAMNASRRIGDEYDTVRVPLVFSANDTLARIPVKALISAQLSDKVIILAGPNPVQWEKGVRAFVVQKIDNGTFTLDSVCGSIAQRALSFNAQGLFMMMPQPMGQNGHLKFSAYEEGNYKVEIVNSLGERALLLADEYFHRGEYQLPVDASSLADGSYTARIIAPSRIFNLPMMVLR